MKGMQKCLLTTGYFDYDSMEKKNEPLPLTGLKYVDVCVLFRLT